MSRRLQNQECIPTLWGPVEPAWLEDDRLTARQCQVLRFISDYTAREGYPPTQAELADGLRPPIERASAQYFLNTLRRKGCLRFGRGRVRALALTDLGRLLMAAGPCVWNRDG